MKLALALLLAFATCTGWAQLQWLPDDAPQCVFAERAQKVRATIRNPTEQAVTLNLRTRLFQLSSATAAPIGEARPWKRLQALPGQTIIEDVSVNFPAVKIGNRFRVGFQDDNDKPVAHLDVLVFPDTLLRALKSLAGDKPPGLFDPDQRLAPLLKPLALEFDDLENGAGIEGFPGRLAIVLASTNADREPSSVELSRRVFKLARTGRAVVWLPAPPARPVLVASPVVLTRVGSGAVVTASGALLSGLADSPHAQLSLLHWAELAVKPELIEPRNPNPERAE